jgi:dipeptidase E
MTSPSATWEKTVPEQTRIVAIGGGKLEEAETLSIHRHIVRLTGKRGANALMIPTAGGDPEDTIAAFEDVYGRKLKCWTRILRLVRDPVSRRQMASMVRDADLIYVSGGNTYRMMCIWRRVGLDAMLRRAVSRGVVGAGVSAGANCWFTHCQGGRRSSAQSEARSIIRVSGLGVVPALFCPHYGDKRRKEAIARMVARHGGVAIGCGDYAAVEVVGDTYRILTCAEGARAHKVFKHNGEVLTQELPAGKRYRPLQELLANGSATATATIGHR